MTNLTRVTIPQLREILPVTLATDRQPVVILGPPGVAKTQFCRDEAPAIYANVLGIEPAEVGYIEFNAGQRDPVEISGIGLPKKGADRWETEFSRSPLLCMIEATGKEFGILNIDELTQCSPEMQKVLRPLLDSDTRTSGGDRLPDGWAVIATGNRLADKAGSTRLLSHVANAALRFELAFDFAAWRDWATARGLHPLVIGWVEARRDSGIFADTVPAEDTQYCTPRSLSRAAIHVTHMAGGIHGRPRTDDTARRMAEATIGTAAAEQLLTHLELFDQLPTAAAIQNDPAAALLPDRTDLQYMASNVALATATDAETGDRALSYICRLRADLQISVACALLRKSTREGWTLTGPTAAQFIAKYHELLPLAA